MIPTTTVTANLATVDFDYVASQVLRRSAIVLNIEKQYLVTSRLSPVARELGFADITELVTCARRANDEKILARIVEAMTTNETSWFRDSHPFMTLHRKVLPDLLEHRSQARSLRVWSAACSTGQELYSIAMLLDTEFPEVSNWSVALQGTDLSQEVLTKARSGKYSGLEINRGLPADKLVRYFERSGHEFLIAERLRRLTTWSTQNLIEPWPKNPKWDVIMLRNVLIYFDVDTKRKILDNIRDSLAPGGYLFLGASETTLGVMKGFVPVSDKNSVVYQAT